MHILIDWGTTNARAYLMDDAGAIVETRSDGPGIMRVPADGFAAALETLIDGWRPDGDGAIPVLMAGMVGSRQGWVEAPYLRPPLGLETLAGQIFPVPDAPGVAVVPGVALERNGHMDVMRGEEVQILGCLPTLGDDGLVCLPGTHSKWARIEGGRLVDFMTAMTGELFQVLRQHSILGALMSSKHEPDGVEPGDGEPDWNAFDQGLARAADPGGLTHHLFSVRADGLFNRLPASGLADYLSGILLGHEIDDLAHLAGAQGDRPVVLVGAGPLCRRYARALTARGLSSTEIQGADATIRGLSAIMAKTGATAAQQGHDQ